MINTTTYKRTMPYTFQAIVTARGFHIYRNITWNDAVPVQKVKVELETNEKSRKIDPYCCAIKAMVDQPPLLKTVSHIPSEISRHV